MNNEVEKEYIKNKSLALEIQRMFDEDQDMRKKNLLGSEDDYWDPDLDKRNTSRLKEIIAEFGLPGASLIGKDGSNYVYLLIQHADHDVSFQAQCLDIMQSAQDGEFEKSDIAYLTDRVRVNQGKTQLYGTQWQQENGKHVPKPIENEQQLEELRKLMGLCTMEESRKEMYEIYPFKT